MTCSKHTYVDVDFTVVHQHPKIPNADVETVMTRRRVPKRCFAFGTANKRQVVCLGRMSRRDVPKQIAVRVSALADKWVASQLDYVAAMDARAASRPTSSKIH